MTKFTSLYPRRLRCGNRPRPAAKRFFKKLMGADHRRLPFTIGADKHASCPETFAASVEEKVLPLDCKLTQADLEIGNKKA